MLYDYFLDFLFMFSNATTLLMTKLLAYWTQSFIVKFACRRALSVGATCYPVRASCLGLCWVMCRRCLRAQTLPWPPLLLNTSCAHSSPSQRTSPSKHHALFTNSPSLAFMSVTLLPFHTRDIIAQESMPSLVLNEEKL